MSKHIGIIKLTRLINEAIKDYDCGKCPWDDECHKINCKCSVAMTIRALVEGGYLEIKKRKTRKRKAEVKTCDTCKHSEWFAEYAMTVCEKHGDVDMREVCEDYEEKGGANEA